jgi:hypothetical protein
MFEIVVDLLHVVVLRNKTFDCRAAGDHGNDTNEKALLWQPALFMRVVH